MQELQDSQERSAELSYAQEQERHHTLRAIASLAVGTAAAFNTYAISEMQNTDFKASAVVAVGALVIAATDGLIARRYYKQEQAKQ